MKYLQKQGYRIVPINPRLAGKSMVRLFAKKSAKFTSIDVVDVFRPPKNV